MNKRLSLFLALMVTASLSLGQVIASAATTEASGISTIQSTVAMNLGKVTGAAGSTVVVPVTLTGASTTPTDAALFTINYDATKLEAVSVTGGALVTSAATDLSFNNVLEGASSKVIVMWSDETTTGTRAIKTDGVVVNVAFKILATTPQVVPLTVTEQSFCDAAAVEVVPTITAGSVTVGTIPNSTISPASVTFVQGSAMDASFAITLNGNTPVRLAIGNYTLKATDFTMVGNVVTIKKALLATAPVGTSKITVDVSGGLDPTFSVVVTPKIVIPATISPTSVTFTKGSAVDTSFTMTLNGNKPLAMYVGTYKLIYGTDWTLAGNVVTIKKSLLATAPVGTNVIRLDVDAGVDPTFSIIVK